MFSNDITGASVSWVVLRRAVSLLFVDPPLIPGDSVHHSVSSTRIPTLCRRPGCAGERVAAETRRTVKLLLLLESEEFLISGSALTIQIHTRQKYSSNL